MKFSTTIFVICTLITSNHLFSQTVNDKKAEEIIEKAIQASGGKEFLNGIKTLYTNSETTMDGRKVNWITKEMAPNKGRFEIEYRGRIVYSSWFDGKTGYEMSNGEKKIADQEEFRDKVNRKYIMNELAYIDPMLYKLEFIETNQDKAYHKIKATYVTGKITYLFYDTNSFLLTKSETIENAEKNSYSTVLHEDYKKFGDLLYSTKSTFVSENGNQTTTLIDLYYNKNIKEKDFK